MYFEVKNTTDKFRSLHIRILQVIFSFVYSFNLNQQNYFCPLLKLKNMKTIITSILLISILNCELTAQNNVNQLSQCDSLKMEAQQHFGCGHAIQSRYRLMKQAADCYSTNNKIDKAIALANYYLKNIDEHLIGHGWTEKLISYQRKKNGDEYVKNQLSIAELYINVNETYLEMFDTLTLTTAFAWEELFEVTVSLFGEKYSISSTAETRHLDNEVCNDFIRSKKSKEELENYFNQRWRHSIMYKTIERIK